VAAKLGAREVCGIDHDELSVEIARENVGKNRVSDIVKMRRGTIGAVRKRFDVIVANIDLRGLRKMRGPLIRHLKNEGLLILSGLLEGEDRKLCQHYLKTESLQWIESVQQEEWVCLTFKKKKGE
jgi:ribosomal protein L11 methyltransferase